jgi:hypothetical protein
MGEGLVMAVIGEVESSTCPQLDRVKSDFEIRYVKNQEKEGKERKQLLDTYKQEVYEMVKGRKFDRLSEMVTEADCYGMWGQK